MTPKSLLKHTYIAGQENLCFCALSITTSFCMRHDKTVTFYDISQAAIDLPPSIPIAAHAIFGLHLRFASLDLSACRSCFPVDESLF